MTDCESRESEISEKIHFATDKYLPSNSAILALTEPCSHIAVSHHTETFVQYVTYQREKFYIFLRKASRLEPC